MTDENINAVLVVRAEEGVAVQISGDVDIYTAYTFLKIGLKQLQEQLGIE